MDVPGLIGRLRADESKMATVADGKMVLARGGSAQANNAEGTLNI